MKRIGADTMAWVLACGLLASSALAQTEPPVQAAQAAGAADEAPAAEPATEAATTEAPTTEPAATEPATTGAATTEPPAAGVEVSAEAPADDASDEDARIELERARLRMELARARAQRDAAAAAQRGRAVPAPPEHGDAGAALAIGVTLELPWNTDVGFDAFSRDDVVGRYGVWAAYDLLAIRDDVFLAPELGVAADSTERNHVLGGVLNTRLESTVLHAGAQLRYVPLAWLQPHVRLTGGVQYAEAELSSGGRRYSDSAWLPFGSLGAGIMLRTPTRMFEARQGRFASLSFGVLIEGGYTLVAPFAVTLDGSGPSGRDIALGEASLGELDRSGPFVRTSVVVRY